MWVLFVWLPFSGWYVSAKFVGRFISENKIWFQ
uniref:Uncharacterized protein n=1 Tax=Anguilla anguilla TaxID=7936 RepID=A0A0E9PPT4_ANGAN